MRKRTNTHSPYVSMYRLHTHTLAHTYHQQHTFRKIIISFLTNKIVFEFIAFVFHLVTVCNSGLVFFASLLFGPCVISIDMRYYRSQLCHESMTLFPICWPLRKISEVVCYVFFIQLNITACSVSEFCFDHQKSVSIFFIHFVVFGEWSRH